MAYYYPPPASLPSHQQVWLPMVVPQQAPQVQTGVVALHQSMMNFCQTATTALQEQQRLAVEMRETLAKIQALFPDPGEVPALAPRGEVGGRLSPTPSPRDSHRDFISSARRPVQFLDDCPEDCQCMGVKGLCGQGSPLTPLDSSGAGLRLELEGGEESVAPKPTTAWVPEKCCQECKAAGKFTHPYGSATEWWRTEWRASLTPRVETDTSGEKGKLEEDEWGYSTDGYTPRSDDENQDQKAQACFDKYTARWGVTHGGEKINYDEPVYTPEGNGMMMPRGVFQDSGWGGWGDDIVVGDIVRTFPLGGICDKTKQYGIVTKLKKGDTKRLDAFVVDIIMFIPEMERELNSRLESPITGMCGYKIGLQKTFGAQRRMAKLV
jgi:hypothetical protein